jgi:predicted RNA-binding protein with TRAM domain
MPFERRSFGRRFQKIPKPVNVGEEYDVEITETGSKGDGITRIKNFVVFVPGSNKGEKKHIRIKEVRNKFAVGEVIESTEASKESAESV